MLLVIGGLGSAGCQGKTQEQVVTTIYPLQMIASEIAGDQVSVRGLVPPGANPHTYEPTPRQIAALSSAEIVLFAGPALEPWVVRSAGKNSVLLDASEMGQAVENDPHVWLDPVRAKAIARGLEKAMAEKWPSKKEKFQENLKSFCARVDSFDRWFRAQMDSIPDKRFISVHPAWRYFSERYGLVEASSLNITHGSEVSPGTLERVINTMNQQGVRPVFGSVRGNPDEVSVLEKEAGAKVALLDPIGDPEDPERSDYISLMFYNAKEILRVMR